MNASETNGWEQACENTFRYASDHSPYYRQLFGSGSKMPPWSRIPTTDKRALSERNLDFLCVPPERVVEIVTTSGTSGEPVVWMLTEADLQRLARSECEAFAGAGLTPHDTVLLTVTLDRCFIAGLAYALGLRQLGAASIRVGPSSPLLVLNSLERLRPTAIVAVPSFLRILERKAQEMGFDLRGTSIRKLICIGEPIREAGGRLNANGKAISQAWNAALYSTYGVTELACGCCECEAGQGSHVPVDLLHLEILDDAGNAVEGGVPGEVVATTIGVEAMPLLRYRTGDCATLTTAPCSCGRLSPRLGPILGRKQQKLKIKGASVFPLALQNLLDGATGVKNYVIVATALGDLADDIEVLYEGPAEIDTLRETFRAETKIVPRIRLASPTEIEALQISGEGRKRQLFVDRRGLR